MSIIWWSNRYVICFTILGVGVWIKGFIHFNSLSAFAWPTMTPPAKKKPNKTKNEKPINDHRQANRKMLLWAFGWNMFTLFASSGHLFCNFFNGKNAEHWCRCMSINDNVWIYRQSFQDTHHVRFIVNYYFLQCFIKKDQNLQKYR